MGLIKETLKEAFEDTKQEFGFAKPDWIVSNLQKIGLMIWWAFVAIWFGAQIYLPIKLFMYGKMNNSPTIMFCTVFVMLISFVITAFLLNFTMKLHDKIMEKK